MKQDAASGKKALTLGGVTLKSRQIYLLRALYSARGTKNYKKRDMEIAGPGINLEQHIGY